MKVQTISKLYDIAKRANYPALQYIIVKDGCIYATDSYIAFKIKTNELPEDANGVINHEYISSMKNSALIDISKTPYLNPIEAYEYKYPNIETAFEYKPDDGNKEFLYINPEFMIRAMQVFKSYCTPKRVINPKITETNNRLFLTYECEYYSIECVIMKAHVKDA